MDWIDKSSPSLERPNPITYRLLLFFDRDYINIPREFTRPSLHYGTAYGTAVSQKHPRISFGRAGRDRETFVNPKMSTTISVEFAPPFHKYFGVYRPDLRDSKFFGDGPGIPIMPSQSEELKDYTNLRAGYVEIQFQTSKGKFRFILRRPTTS